MFDVWSKIFQRSYSKHYHKRYPTYVGCSVDEKWHCFQDFGDWFEENYKPEYMQNWELDKDIIVNSNKIYSTNTCAFVPKEVNYLFKSTKSFRGDCPIGVRKQGDKFVATIRINNKQTYLGSFSTMEAAFLSFKTAKEKYIKEVADKYKDTLDPQVYKSMYSYEIKITD